MSGELSCVTVDHKSSIRVGRKSSSDDTLETYILYMSLVTRLMPVVTCNVFIVVVADYEVIQSHKHLDMFRVSGQGRDDNMTGPGDV